jgi:hypothetical protein
MSWIWSAFDVDTPPVGEDVQPAEWERRPSDRRAPSMCRIRTPLGMR